MNEQQIGDYNILKKVGAGGMAQVYLAVHKDVPNLKVVLKILTDPRLVERFKQEADKLALLDGHGNICQIKHFFYHGSEIVIAMEYIDGTTLDEMIKGRGKLEAGESLKIIDEVLATLEFAHKKRICHRDIKPSNIMIDTNGQVKIIDFGIAKAETDPDLTIAGAAVGTPAYMAPEQFTPTEHTNYDQIDVYAVGTTLYYMITGELPFKGDNQFVLREAKLFSEPTKPRDIDREIPRPLEEIILKALKRDPEQRYKTATEMRTAIGAFLKETGTADETAYVEKDKSEKPATGKSPIFKPILIGAGILTAAIVSYFAFFSAGDREELLPPELFSPVNGASVAANQPQFVWQATADKEGTYLLQYAADSNFAAPRIVADIAENRYMPDDSLPDGQYFWKVQTVDKEKIRSPFSTVYSFTVETAILNIPQGILELAVRPSGDIYIDGELYSENQKGAEINLDTGRHVVVVRNVSSLEKVFDETVSISANTRESRRYTYSFPKSDNNKPQDTSKAQEPKGEFGRLSVGSRPANGAMIFINDRLEDQLTPYTFSRKAGEYIVRVQLTIDGKELTLSDTVIVAADSASKLIFDFEKQ